jgi:hypothetical protein
MPHVADVVIQSSQVPADLTDFVVYVDLSDLPTSEFWGTVANGGGDIRCYKSDGTTQLAREVVSCDTATDTGELHIRYTGTTSSSSNTPIQIWTDEGTEPAVTATYGRNNVWTGYAGVYHLSDDPSSGTFVDSTGSRDMSTLTSMASGDSVAGKIGEAVTFNGSNEGAFVNSVASGSMPIGAQAWSKVANTTGDHVAASVVDKDFSNRRGIGIYGSRNSGEFGAYSDDSGDFWLESGGTVSAGTWHLLHGYAGVAPLSSDGLILYADGNLIGDTSRSGFVTPTLDRMAIGYMSDSTPNGYFTGEIDEVRFFTSELSSDWISTEYTNQNTPNTFYTVSAVASGTDVAPYGMQSLHQIAQPIAASRLNGVMQ